MIALKKRVSAASTGLAVLCFFVLPSLTAAEPNKTGAEDDQRQILKRIETLELRLAALERKLNRLFNALGPYIEEMETEARHKRQQDEEDRTLAMSEVLRREDENFTGKLLLLPDTQKLLLAYRDTTVRVVELPSGKTSATIDGLDGSAQCLAAVHGSRFAYAGTLEGTVYRCDLHKGKAVKVCETGGWPVHSVAASADGRYFAWATNGRRGKDKEWEEPDESAHVVDARSGAKLFGVAVGRGDWQALSFSSDGDSVAVIQSGEVILADTSTGHVRHRLRHPSYQSGPLSVAYSPTEPLVAIGYAPCHVALWDATSGRCLKLVKGHSNWVVSLSFTTDGHALVSSAGDCTASVWDVATGNEVGRLRFGDGPTYVRSVSAGQPYVAIARSGEFVVCLLSKGTGEQGAPADADKPRR